MPGMPWLVERCSCPSHSTPTCRLRSMRAPLRPTSAHTLWTCPDNLKSKDKCVLDKQSIEQLAVDQDATASALWLGGVMPRSRAMQRPVRVRRAEARYLIDGPFQEIMKITQQVGVDGGGGRLGKTPILRCVGPGGSAILFHPTIPGLVMSRCMIYSKVPGRQTVCRAEAWALHNVIDLWPGDYPLEIIVDATFVVWNGLGQEE